MNFDEAKAQLFLEAVQAEERRDRIINLFTGREILKGFPFLLFLAIVNTILSLLFISKENFCILFLVFSGMELAVCSGVFQYIEKEIDLPIINKLNDLLKKDFENQIRLEYRSAWNVVLCLSQTKNDVEETRKYKISNNSYSLLEKVKIIFCYIDELNKHRN